MKRRLLDHLVCPVDRQPLELVAWETQAQPLSSEQRARAAANGIDPASLEVEIESGVLLNRRRRLAYPIHRGVPRMLVFETAVLREFTARHAERIASEVPGFTFPALPSAPGEADVLRTFSQEWTDYDWSGDSYWNLDPQVWFKCMRFILDVERRPVNGKLVLEVGIGIGATADHLASEAGCELVGVDLGYAVDGAHKTFGKNPFLHIVQASAFAPPFREATFDFVYSFGVIHHTYSTKAAFDQLSRLPRVGGRLFIWVYSHYDEERTLARRVIMKMERVLRPAVWRLPTPLQTAALLPLVPLYMGYQLRRRAELGNGQIAYGFREAIHAARDRFTPRFIHRHTDEEVAAWFAAAGYSDLTSCSERDVQRPDFVPIGFTACTGVDGVRNGAGVRPAAP